MHELGISHEEFESLPRGTQQYLEFSQRVNSMFSSMRERTEGERWRADGIGSCKIPLSFVRMNFEGGIADPIVLIGDRINDETPGQRFTTGCKCHRKNSGCTLGAFKSPLCLSDIEGNWGVEIGLKFNINDEMLTQYIELVIREIAGTDEFGLLIVGLKDTPMDGTSDEFMASAFEMIQQIRNRVSSLPILENPRFKIFKDNRKRIETIRSRVEREYEQLRVFNDASEDLKKFLEQNIFFDKPKQSSS